MGMDQFNTLINFIGEHESQFSGVAAIIAIVGVSAALIARLVKSVSSRKALPVEAETTERLPRPHSVRQDIRYTRTDDGVRLAWSSVGSGIPLVRSLGWFTNLEHEWNDPGSRACIEALASQYQLVRYDARGIGLSQREVDEVSTATRLIDLEAVIDAAGIDKCILMGFSEGGTTAIEYAAKHPDRVSHLILWGSYLAPSLEQSNLDQWTALVELVPAQWGGDNRSFRQMFTSMFMPDGNAAQNQFFNEMQKQSATPEIAMQTILSIAEVDVREQAASLSVPTLVLHRVDDLVIPMEAAMDSAATIPGARLVQLPGANHWILSDQQAFAEILAEINNFTAR